MNDMKSETPEGLISIGIGTPCKLSDLEAGDFVIVAGICDLAEDTAHMVKASKSEKYEGELYLECEHGEHFLQGQEMEDGGYLVGVKLFRKKNDISYDAKKAQRDLENLHKLVHIIVNTDQQLKTLDNDIIPADIEGMMIATTFKLTDIAIDRLAKLRKTVRSQKKKVDYNIQDIVKLEKYLKNYLKDLKKDVDKGQ